MIYEPQEDTHLVLKFIKKYASGSILDVGTGSGVLAREAFNYSKDVTGIDINPNIIE